MASWSWIGFSDLRVGFRELRCLWGFESWLQGIEKFMVGLNECCLAIVALKLGFKVSSYGCTDYVSNH